MGLVVDSPGGLSLQKIMIDSNGGGYPFLSLTAFGGAPSQREPYTLGFKNIDFHITSVGAHSDDSEWAKVAFSSFFPIPLNFH